MHRDRLNSGLDNGFDSGQQQIKARRGMNKEHG
jgi:hypothetical protein